MFGFLLKILVVALVIGGIGGYILLKKGSLPNLSLESLKQLPLDTQVLGVVKDNLSSGDFGGKISAALDSLVTHPDRNSPVVLGIKATNESVSLITDALMNMPNDKLDQIKQVLCSPVSSPSATQP